MLDAWAGKPVAHEGDSAVVLAPLPWQRPHPELWMAAFGPLALKQAGSLAMPYLASPVETLESLKQNYDLFNVAVAEAGREPVQTVPVMRSIFISEERGLVKAVKLALSDSMPHAMRTENASVDDWAIIGDAGYVKSQLEKYQEVLGVTHFIARGRLPEVSATQQIASHEQLLALDM
jgi:alkanesulfonate monooxygenase SsuD/methylene tetrahydromethanopterin reductase-like flavin-dependent oxidoreductase (luciferase family)